MRGGVWVSAVVSVVLCAYSAEANPYLLKCTTSDGQPTADLTVDLDHRVATWGWSEPICEPH
jgi:hypothetical protein